MKSTVEIREEAESHAAIMLAAHWNEDLYPVDPFAIAKDAGIDAYQGDLPDDLSGMLLVRDGKVEMYVDTVDHPRRQRFSAAHELGHYFKRQLNGDLVEGAAFVDRRGWAASAGVDPEEIYANAFAAALLMPRAIVDELGARGLSAFEMARFFDVSSSAMSIRLQNLAAA